ncbi:hypothetical protein ACFFSW_00080 [Saccharothrix longispora]|uniref:ABC-type branched-subunit amino acid transport system substrate-binding protein n=1 Tax=Saccharothrix longispora TaxID=33920 RepID=A0ABU1PUT0_9PSEU|nr:hypothetical protein [Saccharothrix longispora]MDR6594379.1 hypothetical protein [Saccharothrix longispora]
MLKPVDGMDDLVFALEDVIGNRPAAPSPVVVATSDDPASNSEFLTDVERRLSDFDGRDLVPHAHAKPDLAEASAGNALPTDAALLDLLAQELKNTTPRGAGRNWKTPRFQLVLDVLEVGQDVNWTSVATQKSTLLTLLYRRWESRHPFLAWAREMSSANFPIQWIGVVLTAILSGPSRWLFSRRINGRSTRRLREQFANAGRTGGGFPYQALLLLPAGNPEGHTDLRRRLLVGSILQDLADVMRRGRISPRRRRRQWTPVVLLDGVHPLTAVLLDQFAEQVKDHEPAPLLVVGTLAPEHAERVAKTVHTVPEAAKALRRFLKGDRTALPRPPYLAFRLPRDEVVDPAVEIRLTPHKAVAPRVPGVSAFVPLALVLTVVAGGLGVGVHHYLRGGCADTRVNAAGERVGVIESGCSFVSGKTGFGDKVPDLALLEQRVAENNEAVDRLKDRQGKPRYYRTVVFFGPLTRADQAESTAPPNAIWQLAGVVDLHQEHNRLADSDDGRVPVKLILANSGDRFTDGRWVAERIAERERVGRGELAAVIGISQSRPEALEAVGGLTGIPVIGAAMYGSEMAQNPNMFLSSPFNAAFAEEIATWVRGQGKQGSAVVYDPDDPYFSNELRDELNARGVGSEDKDVVAKETPGKGGKGEPTLKKEDVARLCAEADTVVPVVAGRGDQLLKLLSIGATLKACKDRVDRPIRLIAGPGGVVVAAQDVLDDYKWARVWVAGLADTAEQSERTAGANAFGMATQAIADAHLATTQFPDWDVSQVLASLRDPDFDYDGLKPNVTGIGEGRVHIIQPEAVGNG